MADNLVGRLRALAVTALSQGNLRGNIRSARNTLREAADTIERLERERDEVRNVIERQRQLEQIAARFLRGAR